jgi:alpha-mannosidase
MNKEYHIISHTHWDREWYEPFERFRIRLVRLIDNLLELLDKEPDFIFHLDAQTAVIDDYLEIKPANRQELTKHISQGRILIGPWFIQNDFFLTSGESTVRNLLIGTARAGELGCHEYVGYTPDQFGLPSQLPSILNGFGISDVVFVRGRICKDEHGGKAEFIWSCENGSEVFAIQMANFYNNAQRFSEDIDKATALLKKISDNLGPLSSTGHLLLMNGVDHLEPQENLLDILPKLQSRLPQGESIHQDTLNNYCKLVRQSISSPAKYQGELRHGGDRMDVQGTLSSRVYLKAQNVKAEKMISAQLEPLCSMLLMLGFKTCDYDKEFLDYLWKLLILNHPHDSICGCSCDEVHRHMEDRFLRFFEAAEHLLQEKMTLVAKHVENNDCSESDYYITVFNTVPHPRAGIVTAQVDIKEDEHIKLFNIISPKGEEIPYEILSHEVTERPARSPINLPGRILVDRYLVKFKAEVPAFGYATYLVRKAKRAAKPAKPMGFENEFLKVTVSDDGKINLFDKSTATEYNNILWLEDTADSGDSYTYRPDHQAALFKTCELKPVMEISDNQLETVCRLKYNLVLPAYYDRDKKQRSKTTVNNPVEIALRLTAESKKLEISFKIDNKAKDHCLRAVINTGIDSAFSYASAPFDVITRDKHNGDIVKRGDLQEPSSDFINIHDEHKGISILHQGLHAYEHFRERKGQIALTLLRATAYIQGFFEIPLDKDWIVPENQCIRELECNLAVMPVSGTEQKEYSASEAADFLAPMFCFSDSCDHQKFSGGRPCVQDSEISEIFFREDPNKNIKLPAENSMLSCGNKSILFIACKKAENGDDLVIRLLNISSDKQSCDLNFGFKISNANLINLKEEKIKKIGVRDSAQIKLDFKPKQIISLRITKQN